MCGGAAALSQEGNHVSVGSRAMLADGKPVSGPLLAARM